MWVPKWQRDRKKGVDSPVPTQVVSNEEFIPRPQNESQKKVEYLIGVLAEEKAKKLGMDRRSFMASSMGLATCFLASNLVYGKHWEVEEIETLEPAATEEKWPKGEYFIFDVQTHFTNGLALGFRDMEFIRNMGFKLKNDADAYSFPNFVKEIFFDSETNMIVISGVPGKEINRGPDGKILEGKARTPGYAGQILPSWLMAQRKKEINDLAGCQRALCQGNCAPNHYWDTKTNAPDWTALFEQMEREVKTYGIDSWKWYCHTDPGRSGNGFRLDDEKLTYPFYERSKKLGLKIFSVHKGYASQSRTLGHLANPADVEKAALDHPDLTFIIYHSALKHDPAEPEFKKEGFFDPTTGDFAWHDVLMKIKQRNPQLTNVYPEIGSAFGSLAIQHPVMCQHLIGKNIKYYGVDHVIWGTDCLWWGSPQWVIDAFKRFQISDELCEKFGYTKLTKEDKAKIFGLNAAKIYGVDVNAPRKGLPRDTFEKLKQAYLDQGGRRTNAAYGWVRAEE
ncbi:MAG TPA: amidohydrolase family protein [Gemmataceae bacterium]|nr:amidohydrolase family protein [Gemmataceae bacterium]